jgi:Kef-type K+ transport system membrane component KefB
MMRDRGLLGTRFGDLLAAAGAMGEFGPILVLTVLVGAASPGQEVLLLVLFVGLAVGVAALATRPKPPTFIAGIQNAMGTSSQMPVRVIMLLIIAMVALATLLGLDMLLGAFAAGLIARLAIPKEVAPVLVPRIESIGFGFLIPVFFIVSGMKFDVTALFDPATAVRVPIFLALLLVVRGLPALVVYRKVLTVKGRAAMAFLQATALPLLVVITELGLESDRMRASNATALVGAGMLSVLLFPLIGFAVLGRDANAEVLEGSGRPEAEEPVDEPDTRLLPGVGDDTL